MLNANRIQNGMRKNDEEDRHRERLLKAVIKILIMFLFFLYK